MRHLLLHHRLGRKEVGPELPFHHQSGNSFSMLLYDVVAHPPVSSASVIWRAYTLPKSMFFNRQISILQNLLPSWGWVPGLVFFTPPSIQLWAATRLAQRTPGSLPKGDAQVLPGIGAAALRTDTFPHDRGHVWLVEQLRLNWIPSVFSKARRQMKVKSSHSTNWPTVNK